MALLPETETERVVYDVVGREIAGAVKRNEDKEVERLSQLREDLLRELRDLWGRSLRESGRRASR